MNEPIAVSLNYKWIPGTPEVWHQSSPTVKLQLVDLETSISIFEDRVNGWFLTHARPLLAAGNGDYVVLQIVLAQIEGLQQFCEGKSSHNDSGPCFARGLTHVLGFGAGDQSNLSDFYRAVRCGLFHNGFTQGAVLVSREYQNAIDFARRPQIYVNAEVLLNKFDIRFKAYVSELRAGSDQVLVTNFQQMWASFWSSSKAILQHLAP